MADLVFQVIDTACEAADQSFFPPRVVMTTKSTTQIATVLGFDEYAPSTPPKRYKTLTWDGHSEQQLWFPAGVPGNTGAAYQIGGARFDYSGSTSIDTNGNYINTYTKNLSEMCNAIGALVPTFVSGFFGGLQGYVFSGWSGASGHELCNPPNVPYAFVSNQAIGKGQSARFDKSSFWGSQSTPQSNVKVSDFTIQSSTQGVCIDSGGTAQDFTLIALFTPVPDGTLLNISGADEGTVWFKSAVIWDHNYSATLSNEYTDAEALANARVVAGNGVVAQNLPRTTGFTSTFTSVVYTLSLSNLIIGSDYVVSVDFWDASSGATITNQVGFTASAATKTIVGLVPTPLPQHTTVVRNPRIAFAP